MGNKITIRITRQGIYNPFEDKADVSNISGQQRAKYCSDQCAQESCYQTLHDEYFHNSAPAGTHGAQDRYVRSLIGNNHH